MFNRGYAYTTITGSKCHGKPCSPTWQAFTPTQHLRPGKKAEQPRSHAQRRTATRRRSGHCGGQTLAWDRPPWMEPDAPRHFDVLFEDAHLLAVDKPSGLPTLPGGGFLESTLLRLVQKRTPSANPVHRLGRGTSGIVLFAKTRQAAATLFADWNTPRVQKIYRALAQNIAQQDAYEILTPIGLVPHPRIGSVWAASPSGKPSKSLAKVISRGTGTTTFEVSLGSGRPHQIRIHLASIRPSAGRRSSVRIGGPASGKSPRPPGRWRIFPARPISEIPPPHYRRANLSGGGGPSIRIGSRSGTTGSHGFVIRISRAGRVTSQYVEREMSSVPFTSWVERRVRVSRIGVWPKKRLYSRVNWLALS